MSELIISYIYKPSRSNFVAIGDEDVDQAIRRVYDNYLETKIAMRLFMENIETSGPFDYDQQKEMFRPISDGCVRLLAELSPVVEQIMHDRTRVPDVLLESIGSLEYCFNVIGAHFDRMVLEENTYYEIVRLVRTVQSLDGYLNRIFMYNNCHVKISLAVVELDKLGIVDLQKNLTQYIRSNHIHDESHGCCVSCIEIILMNSILMTLANFASESRDKFYVDQDLCNDVVNAIMKLPEPLCDFESLRFEDIEFA